MRNIKNKKIQSTNNIRKKLPPPDLNSLLTHKALTLMDLRMRLVLCDDALKDYEDFPNELLVSLTLRNSKISTKYQMKLAKMLVNLEKKAGKDFRIRKNCFDYVVDIWKRNKVDNRDCLGEFSNACLVLFVSTTAGDWADKDMMRFFYHEQFLRTASCEAIGYWTAKLEEMKRNKKGGGAEMKKRGEENKEAIKKVLAELKINSLLVFKKDRKLRGSFMTKAREKTKDDFYNLPLSEKRIFDIARKILKDEVTGLDTKLAV